MQGVSFKLWTEPFLDPFLGWQAGQGVPRCSVRDAQCSWHWEEQAPTWYLEMPTETHQLASPGAIREAEERWENEPACSGCLTFSLFSTQPHLLAQVLQRAKPQHVRHPAGSREPSPHAHPITLQKLTLFPGVPDYLTWLPLSKPLESFSGESSPTSRDTSSLSPALTSYHALAPRKVSIRDTFEGIAHSLRLTWSRKLAVHAQAAFVDPGEVFLPWVQVPKSLVLAAAAALRPRTPGDSLLSFFYSLHFVFSSALWLPWRDFWTGRWGTGSCLGLAHALPGRGNGEWEGCEERTGRRRGWGGGSAPFPHKLIGKLLLKCEVLPENFVSWGRLISL